MTTAEGHPGAPIGAFRSWMFTPANRPERLVKAAQCAADVVIADLEDAVAPQHKDLARAEALHWLSTQQETPFATALRINPLDTRAGLADVCAILDAPAQPQFIILPKASSAVQLRMLDTLFTRHGKRALLVPLIESVDGLDHCQHLARATPRVAALLFGAADMAADLNVRPSWTALSYARARIVAAAAGAGIPAVDSPHFAIHDRTDLTREAALAVELGFSGKAAIHPSQIAVINDTFFPTIAEIKEASDILAAASAGAGIVGERMVDEAMARRARRVLAAADRLTL